MRPVRTFRRRRSASKRRQRLPYLRRESLLSRGETAFFYALQRVVKGQYGISIKTRLADIVQCPEELWETPHGRRLCQKHIDFTLYDRRSLSVVIAIELDDASHDEPSRQARDRFVNEVFRTVNVPLVRVRAAFRYSTSTLEEQIFRHGGL